MKQILAVTQKELRLYWNSPIAYIFIIAFLSVSFWMFFRTFFLYGQVDMRSFFSLLPWIFLFLIPAMTMRLWSEEFRQGTIETLMTSSITTEKLILGKFFASFLFLLTTLGSTLTLPLSISFLGNLDWGVVVVGYIGALFLGTLYISIGLFMSSITSNQIVAFILSILACFILFIIGQPIVTFSLPGFLAPIFSFAGVGSHYESMIRGVIDSKDIIYYLTITFLFLYFNYEVLHSKK